MKTLNIPARYYRVYTDPEVPCDEENFHFVNRDLPIPVSQAALILVDVWSDHYIDSWLQRAAEVTQAKIAPILKAARKIGLTIIHAPSPRVVENNHPDVMSPPKKSESSDKNEWPPREFKTLYRTGDHATFGRNREPRLDTWNASALHNLKIADASTPLPDEPVIANGDQLHKLLTERRILHLFYAGFATNWCVIGRDYGMIAMCNKGYNNILIRDATTGVEFHDTVNNLTATEIAIREIETKYAWSTLTNDVVSACENI